MDKTTVTLANLMSLTAAGLFSWSMIDLVVQDTLQYYLADQKFQLLVLIGGVLLGLVILLRIPSLFGESAHRHDHDHDHDHDEHTHAPSLWRLIVLTLPLMILFMGIPKQGFSAQGLTNKLSAADLAAIDAVGGKSMPAGFDPTAAVSRADWKLLVAAASDPFQRQLFQAKAVEIIGQAVADPRFKDRYRLMRVKITCCAADAVPLNLTVLGSPDPAWEPGQWVEIVGVVDYIAIEEEQTGSGSFFPVIYQIKASTTEPRAYLQ